MATKSVARVIDTRASNFWSDGTITAESHRGHVSFAVHALQEKILELHADVSPEPTEAFLQSVRNWLHAPYVDEVSNSLRTAYACCLDALERVDDPPEYSWSSIADASLFYGMARALRGGRAAVQKEIAEKGGRAKAEKTRKAWAPVVQEYERRVATGWKQGDGNAIAKATEGPLSYDTIRNAVSAWRSGKKPVPN